jgi:non-ribosomal peptide synthetase component F
MVPLIGPGGAESLLDHWAWMVRQIADGLPDLCDAGKLTRIPAPEPGTHNAEEGGKAIAAESITRMWARSVSQFGNQPALETGGTLLSYQELDAQARALASKLLAGGVIAGGPVASLLEDRAQLPIVMLALAMTGGVHVPLDPALPEERQKSILLDSTARFLIAHEPATDLPGITLISPDATSSKAGGANPVDAAPDDLLALLYTSGSTGHSEGRDAHPRRCG